MTYDINIKYLLKLICRHSIVEGWHPSSSSVALCQWWGLMSGPKLMLDIILLIFYNIKYKLGAQMKTTDTQF